MLRIRGLTKRYRTGELALKGIDLEIPDGEVMALIGPSGAGKSTVIRCINRLVEPTSGRVALNNTEITTLAGRELRRVRARMGMIFQEYALVDKIKQAFFSFPWEGSALKAEFKNEDRFLPISYQKDWSVIRKIDAANGVKYTCK